MPEGGYGGRPLPVMRRFRPILLATLAALLLAAAALAPAQASAAEASDDATGGETITTVLHPGWNMVGWVGPETPTSELFDALPALRQVSAWDAEAGSYLRAFRGRYGRLPSLAPGMGLWLDVGGDATVEWTRPVSGEAVLLSLRSGWNLVGWTGEDNAPIEEAVARFGAALVRGSRWNAQARLFERYHPDRPHANSLTELQRGEALWVNLSSDVRWWQPGIARPQFVFTEDVSPEERLAVRKTLESARAVFAERFGVYTADFDVHVGVDDCYGGNPITLPLWCARTPWIVAHEYFHTLQSHMARGARKPTWLEEGSANYAHAVYLGVVDPGSTVSESLQEMRQSAVRGASATAGLASIETYEAFHGARESMNYNVGFLAADWLVRHAGEHALIEYYHLLASRETWESAFEDAFGMGVEDFYEQFEAYRAVVAPSLPHLTDDAIVPVVAFLGEVPEDTRAAIRSETDGFYTILTERFGADPFEYTVYVGADRDAIGDVYLQLSGTRPSPRGSCSYRYHTAVMVSTLECYEVFPHTLIGWGLDAALAQFAPYRSLPPVEEDHDRRGPMWLVRGTEGYTRHAYLATTGEGATEPPQTESAFADPSALRPLSSLETISALNAAGDQVVALGFLAVDWLANHAGDPAVFEYYRLLPSSSSWQTAFEQAFGLTIEDFYEQFEAYRATLQ